MVVESRQLTEIEADQSESSEISKSIETNISVESRIKKLADNQIKMLEILGDLGEKAAKYQSKQKTVNVDSKFLKASVMASFTNIQIILCVYIVIFIYVYYYFTS